MNKKNYTLRTKRGYFFDEVASALQKEIRRCNERDAVYWAYELFDSGYWKYLFKRLVIIAMEDIGKANPDLVGQVLNTFVYVNSLKKPPDPVVVSYIVLQMARSPKSREADELINLIQIQVKENPLEIPEYAVDKHTKRGKAMGKDLTDFWTEGAKLNKEVPSKYKQELFDKLGLSEYVEDIHKKNA